VPASVDDDALRKVGQFRSRHRLPACVYVHHKTRAAMARCSQPLVGLRRSRCSEDEMLLDAMRLANPTDTSTLRIFDARPKVNADANRLKGGGYESYDGCQLEFSNIENIHVMRDSLAKLMRACQTSRMDVYDGNQSELDRDVAASAWLAHVRRILHATNRVVHALERTGSTVLLHCSDGWDRTAQVSALAQIMLEPYHRTIEGFFVVVAKEWLSFGHKFGERHGHGENMANHKDSQRSPVFLQFLDCCWQLLQQFPTAFEFAEPLLLAVRTHLYSSLFGTFLCDSDAERAAARLSQRTLSLFDVLLAAASREPASPLRNSAYVPTKATLVAQADPDDPQEMLARVWLAAYAEGSINDKTATYPDTARRVFAVADAPDAPEATLAAHHLCGLTASAYVRSLRRQQRSARKGSRRHTVSDLSRSKNSDAGHSDTTTADDADQLPPSGSSSSENRKKAPRQRRRRRHRRRRRQWQQHIGNRSSNSSSGGGGGRSKAAPRQGEERVAVDTERTLNPAMLVLLVFVGCCAAVLELHTRLAIRTDANNAPFMADDVSGNAFLPTGRFRLLRSGVELSPTGSLSVPLQSGRDGMAAVVSVRPQNATRNEVVSVKLAVGNLRLFIEQVEPGIVAPASLVTLSLNEDAPIASFRFPPLADGAFVNLTLIVKRVDVAVGFGTTALGHCSAIVRHRPERHRLARWQRPQQHAAARPLCRVLLV
jgi:hypothetical protein